MNWPRWIKHRLSNQQPDPEPVGNEGMDMLARPDVLAAISATKKKLPVNDKPQLGFDPYHIWPPPDD